MGVLHKLGTTTLDGAAYTYDGAGNRLTRLDKRTNVTLTYGYDHIYQLQTAKQGTTTKESYTYDLVGNRLSSLNVPLYNYNSSNELTSTTNGNYTYDSNGNEKSKPDGTTYFWDSENRLTQVILPGGSTVNFKYDPFGRRIQKSSASSTTDYLYDGMNVLEEVDNGGNVLARYTHGAVIDETLSMLRSGATSYYHADGLGSMTSLSSSAGALAETYTYDSFGKLTASTGTLTNPFQYTGREFDPETGIYEYRARYLDQSTGRFLSEDPIRFRGGINFYDYVLNSPTNFMDPTGTVCRYSQSTGRMVCYPSCAVLPKPNKCEAHPPKGLGNPFYDEPGYSGNGPGRNNPDAEDEPYQGPIPQGGWQMTGNWYNKKPGPGRNIMNLNPLPGNACFDTDRDCNTFRMHGDNATGTASEGCIILPPDRINIPLNDTIWVEP
jgi:RHS repeat-associated protein